MGRLLLLSAGVWVVALFLARAPAQVRMTPAQMRAHPAIAYDGPTHDPVARLHERLQRGEVLLESEPVRGYLRAMLRALDVPESSQVLVFSKTSFQAPRIGPSNPRAIASMIQWRWAGCAEATCWSSRHRILDRAPSSTRSIK